MDKDQKINNEFLILETGNIIFDQYRVIRKIGVGGMFSTIYLVENIQKKDDLYVVKVINRTQNITDSAWERFNNECLTSIRVNKCNNVVKTLRIYKYPNNKTVIILMEYVNGNSLRDIINQKGMLTLNESIYIFKKILFILKELYSFNDKIIHRDLKPENIMLSKDLSEVKLIDFGISSVITTKTINSGAKITNILTNEEQLYGTYPYISPLLLKFYKSHSNERNEYINERCDFYSIGVIFYEMLTGNKPFLASNYDDQSIISLPLTYDLPPLAKINPKISIAIENIIFRCIVSKDIDLKFCYKNVDEIIDDINNVENDNIKNTTLLKPYKERIFQNKIFNVNNEVAKIKFYNSPWFFWALFFIVVAIGVLVIIILTNKF